MKYVFVFLVWLFQKDKIECLPKYKLFEKPTIETSCGVLLTAGQYLFINIRDSTQIIGLIKCPDSYGAKFFVEGDFYNITFINDSTFVHTYAVTNNLYNSDSIPQEIVKSIEKYPPLTQE